MREEVPKITHDSCIGGPWCRDKTLINIHKTREKLFLAEYAPGLSTVGGHLRCMPPQQSGMTTACTVAPHYQAGVLGERVHLDILGPFTTSESGNKYVLMIVDQFTRWLELHALPEQTAEIIAKPFFEQWIIT